MSMRCAWASSSKCNNHTTLKFAVSPSSPRFLNERAFLSFSNGVAAGAQEDPVFRHAVCFSFSSGMCNLRAIRLPRLLVSLSVALVFTNISVAGGRKERVHGEVRVLGGRGEATGGSCNVLIC